jgi:hypothetical protein
MVYTTISIVNSVERSGMNLDLLKKLVKLANNNPNENEANAAARKVCEMLAEANFNLGVVIEPLNAAAANAIRAQQDAFNRAMQNLSNRPYLFICRICFNRTQTHNLTRYMDKTCERCRK